jgi:hypothetical protein
MNFKDMSIFKYYHRLERIDQLIRLKSTGLDFYILFCNSNIKIFNGL